jgi:hypothetical protein
MDPASILKEGVEQRLQGSGWSVADVAINRRGRAVYLLMHGDRRSVAMFRPDIEDLIAGRATLDQIIARNRGADLADPWPVES